MHWSQPNGGGAPGKPVAYRRPLEGTPRLGLGAGHGGHGGPSGGLLGMGVGLGQIWSTYGLGLVLGLGVHQYH